MRADRLISLIILLEQSGSMTAKELASELEVSERTIYRDIDALSVAGIPIYGVSGPEGGYSLMEGYRSYLDGLSKEEVLALLSVNIPEQFTQLDFGSKLKAAQLKIRSSYSHISTQGELTAQRLYMDSRDWRSMVSHSEKNIVRTKGHLNNLYEAVVQSQKVKIKYQRPTYSNHIFDQIVSPYGLVLKENHWYLIYSFKKKIQVLNLLHIIQVVQMDDYFQYPQDFLVKNFWDRWCQRASQQLTSFQVRLLVPVQLKNSLPSYLQNGQIPLTPTPMALHSQKWCEIELSFASFEEARSKLLSFGGAVKVIEPVALKYSIQDFAEQILKLYE